MKEESLLFGRNRALVGIVTEPSEQCARADLPAIVLLNSGIIHRIGPNRLYVRMARALASVGFVVLRFDFSGIGDSAPRSDTRPFAKSAISETQEAMDWLSASKGIDRFVLAGICSGALISLRTACFDRRVVGVVSINLAGHRNRDAGDLGRAMMRHYLRIAFSSSFSVKTWLKAMIGEVDHRRMMEVVRSLMAGLLRPKRNKVAALQPNPFVGYLSKLIDRGVSVVLIHSEGDEGLDYVYSALGKKIREWTSSGKLGLEVIRGASHSFTLLSNQADLIQTVERWAQTFRLDPVLLCSESQDDEREMRLSSNCSAKAVGSKRA